MIVSVSLRQIEEQSKRENGTRLLRFGLEGGPTRWTGKTLALTAEQKATLLSGGFYVNVHTAANPGGEIRGQISCTQ